MPNRFSAGSFIPNRDSKLFFDTNIWLKISGANPASNKKNRDYGRLLKNSQDPNVQAKIGTSTTVISEFLNRFCRDDFDANHPEFQNYKAFRASKDFAMTAKAAVIAAQGILKVSTVLPIDTGDGDASRESIEKNLNLFLSGKIDFNDAVIVETCRKHGYTLVTDDGDFVDVDIPIVSANSKFFFSNKTGTLVKALSSRLRSSL